MNIALSGTFTEVSNRIGLIFLENFGGLRGPMLLLLPCVSEQHSLSLIITIPDVHFPELDLERSKKILQTLYAVLMSFFFDSDKCTNCQSRKIALL